MALDEIVKYFVVIEVNICIVEIGLVVSYLYIFRKQNLS